MVKVTEIGRARNAEAIAESLATLLIRFYYLDLRAAITFGQQTAGDGSTHIAATNHRYLLFRRRHYIATKVSLVWPSTGLTLVNPSPKLWIASCGLILGQFTANS